MATIIKIKTSSGLGKPATAKIGELSYSYATGAYNTLGDKLFIGVGPVDGNGDATTQEVIGGKYFTNLLDHQPGVLTASSGLIVDANKALEMISSYKNGLNALCEAIETKTESVQRYCAECPYNN